MSQLFPTQSAAVKYAQSLTDKYCPETIEFFIGLEKPKRIISRLLREPKPDSYIFVGPSGTGKTSVAMAIARELPAELIHTSASKCTIEAVDSIWERVHFCPGRGQFWLALTDEADCMSTTAQNALLSKLDGAGNLKSTFGGGFEMGAPLPVIWIFTCNQLDRFEPRFLSRNKILDFSSYGMGEDLKDYLRYIWSQETEATPPDFGKIVKQTGNNCRAAVNELELALMEV